MNKAILISIKSKYVADILNGKKTIELRKTKPHCDLPIDVYIYCTQGGEMIYMWDDNKYHVTSIKNYKPHYCKNGKVVAKFTLKKVYTYEPNNYDDAYLMKNACVNWESFYDYYSDTQTRYAWFIEDLVIFDKPKQLSDFDYCTIDGACECCHYSQYREKPYLKFENCRHVKHIKAPQSWMFIKQLL